MGLADAFAESAGHCGSSQVPEQIKQQSHIDVLCESKYQASQQYAQNRLQKASALTPDLLQGAIDRGHVLKRALRELNELLNTYGLAEFHFGVEEAPNNHSQTADAVSKVLVRRRNEQGRQPVIAIPVLDSARHMVKPLQLNTYDTLYTPGDNDYD